MPLPSVDGLDQTFFAAAEQAAKRHGVHFGDGAAADIRNMTRRAANMILEQAGRKGDGAEPYVSANTAIGIVSITQFVEQMVAARGEVAGYAGSKPDVIGELTFGRAASILCPFFFFC